MRLLVVEDDPQLRDVMSIFLERDPSFSVESVESGQEALDKIAKRQFDAIVADFQIPPPNGLELLIQLRESGNTIPFIIFTGRGNEDVAVDALNNGADFYLPKGGDPLAQFAQLKKMIRSAVEKRMAEEALVRSIHRFSDILDAMPDGVFALDAGHRVIAWNRALESFTGVEAERMIGREQGEYAEPFFGSRRPMLVDLIFAPDEEIVSMGYSAIQRSGRTVAAETPFDSPNGHDGILREVAVPLYDESGTIAGAIASVRDVTAGCRVRAELSRSRAMVRALLDSHPAAVAILDRDLRPVWANSPFFTLCGRPGPTGPAREPFPIPTKIIEAARTGAGARFKASLRTGDPEMEIVPVRWEGEYMYLLRPAGVKGSPDDS